ncbi:mitochondrial malto-oligosyltrehalose trehalohydrolase/malto-oligosyltrehalose synthase [Andalucia godoyi]|uniref:Mitochondrial malto-oligosyltrehalose trehalohydrolase/malto-oligosyltrehalose synthase n=1 Tax=Andalucia godoyi TaxID=505711 RepID=A0A8K0AJ31_ANDGO|nr:mitochondrial malto-oligosyltrehalose trehalohydrolase/malto-oligosyltrehalose synthase [Andalucia godoyi]|eukprot:ANDGO_01523.mRNA.1 mitochondrial malto-oligosyltrehalose trehalohydrolase/malto-oligosyltrehalose synthase (dual-function protein)
MSSLTLGPRYVLSERQLYIRTWCTRASMSVELLYVVNPDAKNAGMLRVCTVNMKLENETTQLWIVAVPQVSPSDVVWYKFKIDGKEDEQWTDPASRFLPNGVFEWSEFDVCFHTRNGDQQQRTPGEWWPSVIYELHVGTFSSTGTYAGVLSKLQYLKSIGVDCIEIMPLADWVGRWNWGYDGVMLYAPSRCYGTPAELRALIDEAHRLGIRVLCDVVLNHLGIRGNILGKFSPEFFSEKHNTIWGPSWNLDGNDEMSALSRNFLFELLPYLSETFGFDGYRLDATHAIADDSAVHILNEICSVMHQRFPGTLLFGEDDRNSAGLMTRERGSVDSENPAVLDGLWADDFHHSVRVALTGEQQLYYKDFSGSMEELSTCIQKGWLYSGQWSVNQKKLRGSGDPGTVPVGQFITCIQNHDQIGNRPTGDRLHHVIKDDAWIAASALLLLGPETPMIFQGQEWKSSSPFCFFTDFDAEFGKLVSEGRRKEFPNFDEHEVPDPQDEATFLNSKLQWTEVSKKAGNPDSHQKCLDVYKTLINIRNNDILPHIKEFEKGFASSVRNRGRKWRPVVKAVSPSVLAILYVPGDQSLSMYPADTRCFLLLASLASSPEWASFASVSEHPSIASTTALWSVRWSSNDFSVPVSSVEVNLREREIRFPAAGAVLLERHLHSPRIPSATYRLQLHQEFPLRNVPMEYLKRLGIRTLYLSPLCSAVRGSSHGYDGCDYSTLNPEIASSFQELHDVSRSMDILADFVPNHLAALSSGPSNLWWWDAFREGPRSKYFAFFDTFVDWDRGDKLMAPVLGKSLQDCFAARELDIRLFSEIANSTCYSEEDVGSYFLMYIPANLCFPLKRDSCLEIARRFERDALSKGLNSVDVELVQRIVMEQNYRLCLWKEGCEHINYRRFFDVPSLIGVRQEDPKVFQASHDLILNNLCKQGVISGIRLDHTDGLRDPYGYLNSLQRASPGPLYVLVEKILQSFEDLDPLNVFSLHGTTGYDFLRFMNGLFISQGRRTRWLELYESQTGTKTDSESIERMRLDSKRVVVQMFFLPEVRLLSSQAPSQFPLSAEMIAAFLVHFPVYRVFYRKSWPFSREGDFAYVEHALAQAAAANPNLDFSNLRSIFQNALQDDACGAWIARLQQATGPVMAKGIEDTFMYRFYPLLSLCEVGTDPVDFGVHVSAFHACMVQRSTNFPYSMLSSSTHDTKRSEDVRARLNALSDVPDLFLQLWQQYRSFSTSLDAPTDWLLLQTVCGSWPLSRDRLRGYMMKAVREAKVHTSWINVNDEFEQRMNSRIDSIYSIPEITQLISEFVGKTLAPMGFLVSLSQTIVKMTSPGIPDVYQGNEIMDFSLVDPDNRRPVDYALRERCLASSEDLEKKRDFSGIYADQNLGKIHVTRVLLSLRNQASDLLSRGKYHPLFLSGKLEQEFVAYYRAFDSGSVDASSPRACIVLVPRLPFSVATGRRCFAETVIELNSEILSASKSCLWGNICADASKPIRLLSSRTTLIDVFPAEDLPPIAVLVPQPSH